jgi:hypothetical protein
MHTDTACCLAWPVRSCCATRSEVARARLRAAAQRGDPVDVEAVARAYGIAVTIASLAQLGRGFGTMAQILWRRARGRDASSAGAPRAGP